MADDTWVPRELPVLEAVSAGEREHEHMDSPWLANRTGMHIGDVVAALNALQDGKYVQVKNRTDMPDGIWFDGITLAEKGRRSTGDWPAEGNVESFLALLDAHIESEPDPEAKGALAKMREGLAGTPVAIGTALFTEYLKQRLGMS